MQVTEGLKTSIGIHINYITQVEYLLSIKGTPNPSMQVTEGLKTSTDMHINYITQVACYVISCNFDIRGLPVMYAQSLQAQALRAHISRKS